MKPVNTTSSDFTAFIKGDMLYVDKSEHAYRMLTMKGSTTFLFMARPRRFGKSLFVSMLEAALMGKREMFEGLYLGSSDYGFHPYPVIHLDMSKPTATDGADVFRRSLTMHIAEAVSKYGIDPSEYMFSPSDLFMGAIRELNARTGERVAILIDEYDNPLTSTLDAREGKEIREVTRGLYGKLKPCADKIRFLFITGITRFSNQSIFSKLNNLRDLTMDKGYAAAFGYTQQELESYFSEALDTETLSGLKRWYDGYRFADGCEKVYNPISINMYFSTGNGFEPYWGDTASTSLVVDLARRARLSLIPDETIPVDMGVIRNFRVEEIAPEAELDTMAVYGYLFMAGYLTIDRRQGNSVCMRIPNNEVGQILTGALADAYAGPSRKMDISQRIEGALKEGDMDALASAFDEIIRIPTYDMRIDLERFYQSLIYSIAFYSDGVEVRAEEHTAEGRADLVLLVPGRSVIVELKRNRSAEAAVRQIEGKGYMAKYLGKGDEVVLMGVNISTRGKRLRLSWAEKRIPSHT